MIRESSTLRGWERVNLGGLHYIYIHTCLNRSAHKSGFEPLIPYYYPSMSFLSLI